MSEKQPLILNNGFSHFICKVWFNVGAISLAPFNTILFSGKYDTYPQWRRYAILQHEIKHIDQCKKDGKLKFMFKYIFSPKYRLECEAEAYAIDINAYVNEYKIAYIDGVIEECAKTLTSSTYFWMASLDEATIALRKYVYKKN